MKYLFILIMVMYGYSSAGQNFITREGEFMDTAANIDLAYGSRLTYFYNVRGKYPKSSATLLLEVQAFLKNKNTTYSGSGYITFHFVIDTTGAMLHRVSVTQTDDNYKSYHFGKDLVGELYGFLQTLDKWHPFRAPNGISYSYISFLSFKIRNGKVINIIP